MPDARFFAKEGGLRAYAAAAAVRDLGPLAYGADRQFWAYVDGVWQPGEEVLHARVCRVLREDYRPGHAETVRHVLRAELDRLSVDPVPDLINFRNGMLRWADPAADPVPHDHRYLSTVQLPVSYRADAQCPEVDAFLAEAVAPDDVMRVWEVIGYLMMSGNPLQRAILLTGGGGNGKSVLLEIIKQLLGRSNCVAVPLHDFGVNRFVTAELFGRLANVVGDIDATFIENTSRIKEIVGDDGMVMGERKGEHPFYFDPWCCMIFSANDIPASADSSRGWTRRFEVIDFPNSPAVPDPTLKARLTTQANLRGVAARAVDALRGLMLRREFVRGEAALSAHQRFAERSNKVLQWLHDIEACVYPDPSAWYKSKDLYMAFRAWDQREDPGSRGMGKHSFLAKLRQAPGMREVRSNGYPGFRGVRLSSDIAFGQVIEIGSTDTDGEKVTPPKSHHDQMSLTWEDVDQSDK